jgi:O-antigen/teichoic acid export membrane protein
MSQPSQSEQLPSNTIESSAAPERCTSRGWPAFVWPWRSDRQTEITHGFLVMSDQAVVSIANFTTTLIIGRICLQEELGLYALGFTLILYLSGISKAMVWSPYTAFFPKMDRHERAEYTASATLQLAIVACLACFGLAVAGAVAQFVIGNAQVAKLFWLLSPAAVLMMTREHVRRLCLAWRNAGDLLRFDIIVSGLQILGIISLAKTGWLTGSNAYLAIITACLVSLVWLFRCREKFHFHSDRWLIHLKKNWNFAKWLFGGATLVLIEQGLFYWCLTYYYGMTAVGILAAAQSVVMIANPVLLGLANYSGPATATTFTKHGIGAMYRTVKWSSAVLLAFVITFFIIIVVAGEPIVVALYGDKYAGNAVVTVAIALGLLVKALLIPIELGFLATEQGEFLFTTAVVRLAVVVTVGLPLVSLCGAAGVGYGICVSSLIVLIWEWTVLRRLVRHA